MSKSLSWMCKALDVLYSYSDGTSCKGGVRIEGDGSSSRSGGLESRGVRYVFRLVSVPVEGVEERILAVGLMGVFSNGIGDARGGGRFQTITRPYHVR